MIKFGVHRPDQYATHNRGPLSVFRKNRLAYSLLRTGVPATAAEIDRFEFIMRHLRLSGGVYRTTLPGRFQQLDAFVQGVLERQFPRETPLMAEDWAASACVTSAEWLPVLVAGFPYATLTASDLHLDLVEATFHGATFILEESGEPLQYVKPPYVLPMSQKEPAALPVNRWLQRTAQRKFRAWKEAGRFDLATLARDLPEWEGGGVRYRRISMVHPAARLLQETTPAFRIRRHSVFDSGPQPCHVVRSMNIFNRSYFDDERLLVGARAVWRTLLPGGIWIVGRSTDVTRPGETELQHVHDASILRKVDSGFEWLDRHQTPSEIETLVLTLRV